MVGWCAATVPAAPIRYEFRGWASGSVDGRQFRDAVISLTALADSDDVAESVPTVHAVDAVVRIQIPGIGAGQVLGPTRVFSSNLSPDRTVLGLTLLQEGDSIVLLEPSPDLPLYDLRSAAGPTFDEHPLIEPGIRSGVPTEFGALGLDDLDGMTFSAIVAVPEASAVGFLAPFLLLVRRRVVRRSIVKAGLRGRGGNALNACFISHRRGRVHRLPRRRTPR